MSTDDKTITVCANCLRASCWQGIFFCEEAQTANIIAKTIKELKKLKREHPSFWKTDDKLSKS